MENEPQYLAIWIFFLLNLRAEKVLVINVLIDLSDKKTSEKRIFQSRLQIQRNHNRFHLWTGQMACRIIFVFCSSVLFKHWRKLVNRVGHYIILKTNSKSSILDLDLCFFNTSLVNDTSLFISIALIYQLLVMIVLSETAAKQETFFLSSFSGHIMWWYQSIVGCMFSIETSPWILAIK